MSSEEQHQWLPQCFPRSVLETQSDGELSQLVQEYIDRRDVVGTGICSPCRELLQEVHGIDTPGARRKHLGRSSNELETAAAGGCKFCALILYHNRESKVPRKEDVQLHYLPPSKALSFHPGTLETNLIDGSSLAMQAAILQGVEHESRTGKMQVPSSDLGRDSTASFVSLWIARQWINDCVLHHESCNVSQVPRNLPTRLIDLGPGNIIRPRLCFGSDLPVSTPYCTLSHCWGKCEFLKLEKGSLEELPQRIPTNKLSKTFKEAMEITKRLHVRYLWIDSLCIIQDSKDDWRRESATMAQVYSNSYCNIAATSSPNGDHGCFRTRKDNLRRTVFDIAHPGEKFLITETYPDWIFMMPTVDDGPLYQRAWVVQEAWLAPRVLHFCGGSGHPELFWQCHEKEASEFYPEGIPKFYPKVLKPKIRRVEPEIPETWPEERLYLYHTWCGLIDTYTRAALTYPATDKYVAISGLARRLADPQYYLAGLWEPLLPAHLLWSSNGLGYKRLKAPSWSWAAVDGHVSHGTDSLGDTEYVLTVLETFVKVEEGGDRTGRIEEGWLHVEGTMVLVEAGVPRKRRSNQAKSIRPVVGEEIRDRSTDLPTVDCELHFDTHEPSLDTPLLLLCVENRTAVDGPSKGGLILSPLSKKGRYTRIGVFSVKQWGSDEHLRVLDQFDELCRVSERAVSEQSRLWETKVLPLPRHALARYTLYIE